MENIHKINMLSLVKGPFLNFKKKGFITKELDKVGFVSVYESNKRIIKTYQPHPN